MFYYRGSKVKHPLATQTLGVLAVKYVGILLVISVAIGLHVSVLTTGKNPLELSSLSFAAVVLVFLGAWWKGRTVVLWRWQNREEFKPLVISTADRFKLIKIETALARLYRNLSREVPQYSRVQIFKTVDLYYSIQAFELVKKSQLELDPILNEISNLSIPDVAKIIEYEDAHSQYVAWPARIPGRWFTEKSINSWRTYLAANNSSNA